jgi:hypothetical protein
MNLDDPKLTAFALGELPPAERPVMEAELTAHPEFAAEVAETREMAGILRTGLKSEPAGELAPHQRDAIFRAARMAQRGEVPASERPAPLISPKAHWWNRPGPWQAVAACAVIGLGISARMQLQAPDTERTLSNVGVERLRSLANNSVSGTAQGAQGNSMESNPTRRGPRVIGSLNPDLAGADLARSANRPGPPTDSTVSEILKSLGKEAGRMQEGTVYADLAQVFRPMAGVAGRYEMIRCPSIKVDVEFGSADGQALTTAPTPESKIRKISKPYLETE